MKALKRFIVNTLAKICRMSGLSDKSIGIIIRSYHFSMPLFLILAILIPDRFISNLAVIFFIGVVFLFFLFNGCLVSALENRFCKDDFMVNTYLIYGATPSNYDRSLGFLWLVIRC